MIVTEDPAQGEKVTVTYHDPLTSEETAGFLRAAQVLKASRPQARGDALQSPAFQRVAEAEATWRW